MKRYHTRWMAFWNCVFMRIRILCGLISAIRVAKKSQEELNLLFYPHLSRMKQGQEGVLTGTEYLICKQVIRDHDEFAGRRGCRINAQPAAEGGFTVWFTLPAR